MRVLVGFLILLTACSPAAERGTRTFEGSGSQGTDTSFQFYVVEGTYSHELSGGCLATAGLFPGDREPPVSLWDVLDADLAINPANALAGPMGVFEIGQKGWTELQIGSGPDCEWTYQVTGDFLPAGGEPE